MGMLLFMIPTAIIIMVIRGEYRRREYTRQPTQHKRNVIILEYVCIKTVRFWLIPEEYGAVVNGSSLVQITQELPLISSSDHTGEAYIKNSIQIESMILHNKNTEQLKGAVIYMASCVALFAALFLLFVYTVSETKSIPQAEISYYRLSDELDDRQVEQVCTSASSLEKVKEFIERIRTNELFEYYEIIEQPVYLRHDNMELNDEMLYCGENNQIVYNQVSYNLVNSLQMNRIALKRLLGINIPSSAFQCDGINALNNHTWCFLGDNYANFYKIGDHLSIMYLDIPFEVEIIGFVDVSICLGEVTKEVNNCIILPVLDFIATNATKRELMFQGILYTQRINGIIHPYEQCTNSIILHSVSDDVFCSEVALIRIIEMYKQQDAYFGLKRIKQWEKNNKQIATMLFLTLYWLSAFLNQYTAVFRLSTKIILRVFQYFVLYILIIAYYYFFSSLLVYTDTILLLYIMMAVVFEIGFIFFYKKKGIIFE